MAVSVIIRRSFADPEKAERLALDLGVGPKLDNLLVAVGYGRVSLRQVMARLLPPEKIEAAPPPQQPRPLTEADFG